MTNIIFLLNFCAIIFQINSQILQISDDELERIYVHQTKNQKFMIEIPPMKTESKNFCQIDPKNFIQQIIFGLIHENHDLMHECFISSKKLIFQTVKELNEYIVYNVSDEILVNDDPMVQTIAKRTAYHHFKEHFLNTITTELRFLQSMCLRRMANTVNESYFSEKIAGYIINDEFNKSVDNFKILKVSSLILSTIEMAMKTHHPRVVEKILFVVDILLERKEIEAAASVLVTLFGTLLMHDMKFTYEMLIVAEKTKIALEQLSMASMSQTEYKFILRKFRFIIVHLPIEVRFFVWEIRLNKNNYCIKNKRSGDMLLFHKSSQGQALYTGSLKDTENLNELKLFKIKFNQNEYFYTLESIHSENKLFKNIKFDRWFFKPVFDGTFYLKTGKSKSVYKYLVDDPELDYSPRFAAVRALNRTDFLKLNGAERWIFEKC